MSKTEGRTDTGVKVAIDNAVRNMASEIVKQILVKVGREVSDLEMAAIQTKALQQALKLKEKESVVRVAREKEAGVIAFEVLEAMESLADNRAILRYGLDKLGKHVGLRVYNKNTDGGVNPTGEPELEDDISALFDGMDMEGMIDDMTHLRDNRTRTVGGASSKKEKDPLLIELDKRIPTLTEILLSKGETVARYAIESFKKSHEFNVIKAKAE